MSDKTIFPQATTALYADGTKVNTQVWTWKKLWRHKTKVTTLNQ